MRKQRGATLIEVLISVLVLAVGLLGLAATQMMSMKNGNSAHQRYMATLAAHDMAERMRANAAGVDQGSYYGEVGEGADNGSQTGGDDAQTGGGDTQTGDDDGADDSAEDGSNDCSSGCSATQLAAMDKREWGELIKANLPSGSGEISSNNGGDGVTITVKWKEQHTGKNYGAAAGGLEEGEFEMTVEL